MIPPGLEATAVASLLDRGAYARHLHQLRKVYLSRRDTLIRAQRRHFGADTQIGGESGGLHLVWRFPERLVQRFRETAPIASTVF